MELIKFNTKFINGYRYNVARGAIVGGNLKILKWLKEQGYQFDSNDWYHAVKYQVLRVLKWAKNNGYKVNQWAFDYAIKNKHLDILKFAYKNNY